MAKGELSKPVTSKVTTHEHPRVLLVDCPTQMYRQLQALGYNVTVGSFGSKYEVPKDGGWRPAIPVNVSLSGYAEQEIIVVDLTDPPVSKPPDFKSVGIDEETLWVHCTSGLLDPRPRMMDYCSEKFDRILRHGGQFIIFAESRSGEEYIPGHRNHVLERSGDPFTLDNWSFLSFLDDSELEIKPDHGMEMNPCEFDFDFHLARVVSKHLPGSTFNCVFNPRYNLEKLWLPIAKSKFGGIVAGVIHIQSTGGSIILAPDLGDKAGFMAAVLKEVLPNLNPALFPDIEGARWVHRPEYELPHVKDLQAQIEATKKQADETIGKLKNLVEVERELNSDWYTLLRGTGRELVVAVMRTLAVLGFENLVDVDEEEKDAPGGKREDVQIHDRSPVLIVDIKGVRGHPEDAESTQSQKHALMRARDWRDQKTDVQPLTIINHQLHLPPHDRDQLAYRKEIIANAAQTGLGLITTWDLWKLSRNAQRLGWPKEVIIPIFYRIGRIEPTPEHYKGVGEIVKKWDHSFGIIPTVPIEVGAKLAVEDGDTFEEFKVTSLRVDNVETQRAEAASNCGVAFQGAAKRFRDKARVYLVSPS